MHQDDLSFFQVLQDGVSDAISRFGAPFFLIFSSLLNFGCSSLFYQPDRQLYYLPKKFGLEAREYSLKTENGETIYAWYLPARLPQGETPKGTIVQFHGNAENMSSHFLSLAWLVEKGYSLLTFDYQGYGKSTGEPSQEVTQKDGLLALQKALELHRESRAKNFVVVGQSLGGAVAVSALSKFSERSLVSLVVLDSTFASYREVAHRVLARRWFTWPLSWLPWVVISDGYAPRNYLDQCDYPILVIHDRRDPAVPYECGETLFSISLCPKKQMWELDEGAHMAGFSLGEEANRERFLRFLDQI